jgi:hypothetical protein
VIAALAEQLHAVVAQMTARGRVASCSDYELKRFAVLDRFAESVLAESQLQDAPERIDDGSFACARVAPR